MKKSIPTLSGCEESYLLNGTNSQKVFSYSKTDVIACKLHSINPSWLMLIGRSWIVGQNAYGSLLLVLRQKLKQGRREINLQQKVPGSICKTAQRIGVAVAIWDIGLNVENRCPIHKIRAADMNDSAVLFRYLSAQQPDAG